MSDQDPKQSAAATQHAITDKPTNQDTPWSIPAGAYSQEHRLCKQMVDAFGESNTDRAQVLARLLLLQDNMLFRTYVHLVSSSLMSSPAPLCVVSLEPSRCTAVSISVHCPVRTTTVAWSHWALLTISKALCIVTSIPDTAPPLEKSCSELTLHRSSPTASITVLLMLARPSRKPSSLSRPSKTRTDRSLNFWP
jgi:hypothetical protein